MKPFIWSATVIMFLTVMGRQVLKASGHHSLVLFVILMILLFAIIYYFTLVPHNSVMREIQKRDEFYKRNPHIKRPNYDLPPSRDRINANDYNAWRKCVQQSSRRNDSKTSDADAK